MKTIASILTTAILLTACLSLTGCAGGAPQTHCELWRNGGGPCGGSGQ